jgi:hypothetical protein
MHIYNRILLHPLDPPSLSYDFVNEPKRRPVP